MSEQWRCPVCETMNDADACIVCGTPKTQVMSGPGGPGADIKNGKIKDSNAGGMSGSTAGGAFKGGSTSGTFKDGSTGGEMKGGTLGGGSMYSGGSAGSGTGSAGSGTGAGGFDAKGVSGASTEVKNSFDGSMTENLGYAADKTRKKKNMMIVIIAIATVILIALFYILFFQKVNAYETNFDQIRVSLLDDYEKVNYYLDKADKAADSGDYSEAEFYLRTKALGISKDNKYVWAEILELDQKKSDMEQMVQDMETVMDKIDDPGQTIAYVIDTAAAQQINEEQYALCQQIAECSDSEVPDDIRETFASIATFCDTCIVYLQDYDIETLMDAKRNLYLCVYEELQWKGEAFITYGQEILQEAYAAFPEDDEFLEYMILYYDQKIQEAIDSGNLEDAHEICDNLEAVDADLYAIRKIEIYELQFDAAMAAGDTDKAYEICDAAVEIDLTTAASWQAEVDAWVAKVDFMKKVKKLYDASDYSGLLSLMNSDSTYKSSTIYFQDGEVVSSISSGKGYIYNSRGVYCGNFANGVRSGSGNQFIYIDSDSYKLFNGNWSGGYPNGKGTYIWWSSDGYKATVTGNFTDGYEDGTMTISWYTNRSWTATYKVEKGTLQDATQNGDKYKYAVAYASDGSSGWWNSSSLDGHGVSYFMK